jgi:hypothetical protein
MSACFTYRLPDASRKFILRQLLSTDGQKQQKQQGMPSHHLLNPQQQQQQQVDESAGLISHDDEESDFLDWDADSAWHPWAQHRDPIQTLELDIVWREIQLADTSGTAGSSSSSSAGCSDGTASAATAAAFAAGRGVLSPAGMTALVLDVSCADEWVLHVLQHGYSSTPARSGRLGVKGYERHRRHVRVEASGGW